MTAITGTGAGAALPPGRGPCPPVGTAPGCFRGARPGLRRGRAGGQGRDRRSGIRGRASCGDSRPRTRERPHRPGGRRQGGGAAEGGPAAVDGAARSAQWDVVQERLWAESPAPPSPPSCVNILTQVIKAISICIPLRYAFPPVTADRGNVVWSSRGTILEQLQNWLGRKTWQRLRANGMDALSRLHPCFFFCAWPCLLFPRMASDGWRVLLF